MVPSANRFKSNRVVLFFLPDLDNCLWGFIMSKDPKKKERKSDEVSVVDSMLSELGVDDEMRRELIDSGRLKGDVFRVESAEEVRRRLEIDKSMETLKDSLNLLERNLMTVEEVIDRVERDLIPIVLTFLVGLKGNLVNLRESIVGRSRRRAKTNLQATFVVKEVGPVVDEEFGKMEERLTSGMSEPILEKIRDITDGLKAALKVTYQEMSTLKANLDDFSQRSATEVEFLAKELTMKPRVEVPKEVQDQLKTFERQVQELQRDLSLAQETLTSRGEQITQLQEALTQSKATSESLEGTIAALRLAPTVDSSEIAELRQKLVGLEASRELLEQKIKDSHKAEEEAIAQAGSLQGEVGKRDLELEDLRGKIRSLQDDMDLSKERLAEADDLRARIRSYESGDAAREMTRVARELDRISAAHDRLTSDHAATLEKLRATEKTLESYMDLMNSTDKTKAYLMVEDVGEMSIREIARSIGLSPARVTQWAEDFERLGIAKLVDGTTIVVDRKKPEE